MMSHQDDNFSQQEINEAWGDWEEQDVTQGSEEWVENQRNKKKEVDESVEARKDKERNDKLAMALAEQTLREMVEQEVKEQEQAQALKETIEHQALMMRELEQALQDLMEQNRQEELVPVTFEQLKEEKTQESVETSEANEQKSGQRRNSNHRLFASHNSGDSTSPTKEEQKNEQSSTLPLSPRFGNK
jgi:hypothetical protein